MLFVVALLLVVAAFALAGRRMTSYAGIAGVLAFVLGIASCITMVGSGHVGVPVLFGQVKDHYIPEGLHLVNPFYSVVQMSIRTQEIKEQASVPSNEGLIVTLDTSLLFRLRPDKAPEVYRTVGANYTGVVVEPTLRSTIRSVTGAHNANALYSSGREAVASEIHAELTKQLTERGVEVETVLLRDFQPPAKLKEAIEAKQQAEQQSLQMQFVLQKEKQEAERKRIEAQGIADFQDIVTKGISPQLLTWKGIEATEELAKSPNSKIIIIGSGDNGLPVILNTTSDKQ